jgi:hypothetical protein
VQENNPLRSPRNTNYFIIDFEYQCKRFKDKKGNEVRTRFDLVGLFWDMETYKKPEHCKLAIIELKYKDASLAGKSGLAAHVEKAEKFLSEKKRVKEFREEMVSIINQKIDLGILNIDNNAHLSIEDIAEKMEFISILADYNQGSSKLTKELSKIKLQSNKKFDILHSSFSSSSPEDALLKEKIKLFQSSKDM